MKKRVFVVCPGIGHIQRGFESFSTQLFEQLSKNAEFEVTLFAGAGRSKADRIVLPVLRREWRITRLLGRILKRDSYFVEQVCFSLLLTPFLMIRRPDCILFSDGTIGNVLSRVRSLVRGKWRLLFSNGGPLIPPYPKCDHLHQVAPSYYDQGTAAGVPAEQQTMIPYGFTVHKRTLPVERSRKRRELGLPPDQIIVISVAAINNKHKRMHYLIDEVASLGAEAPFLLMLGAQEKESKEVCVHATKMLAKGRWLAKTVDPREVQDYLEIADIFCLASLREGFCRAVIEAIAVGIPVVVHDDPVMHFVADRYARYVNMQERGALSVVLANITKAGTPDSLTLEGYDYVSTHFGWDHLIAQYVRLFSELCAPLSSGEDRKESVRV